jgi:hypothetical protein
MNKSPFLFVLYFVIPSISFSQTIEIKAGYNSSKLKAISNWYPDLEGLNEGQKGKEIYS